MTTITPGDNDRVAVAACTAIARGSCATAVATCSAGSADVIVVEYEQDSAQAGISTDPAGAAGGTRSAVAASPASTPCIACILTVAALATGTTGTSLAAGPACTAGADHPAACSAVAASAAIATGHPVGACTARHIGIFTSLAGHPAAADTTGTSGTPHRQQARRAAVTAGSAIRVGTRASATRSTISTVADHQSGIAAGATNARKKSGTTCAAVATGTDRRNRPARATAAARSTGTGLACRPTCTAVAAPAPPQ